MLLARISPEQEIQFAKLAARVFSSSLNWGRKPLRILWVNHIFVDTALYSTFPLQIIESLRKRGHKVVLIAPSIKNKADVPSVGEVRFLPTIRLPMLSSLSFFFMLLLYIPLVVKKERPEVVIGNFFEYPGLIVTKLFRNTRLILDARDSIGNAHSNAFRRLIERILYYTAVSFAEHVCDGITVSSPSLKEELNTCGITKPPVEVISNGVAIELFDYNKNKSYSRELKEQLKLSGKFVVMYHGSLGHFRGLPQTIEAIARINLEHPEIIFFALGLGTDDYVEMLMKLVEKKSLRNNVYIHKPVDRAQVPQFLAMCDVGIDPRGISSWSRSSCPLKLLEYLAMEKPIISTNIPFSAEILERGNCGILIPSDDPKDIAAGIKFMYERRYSLFHMGRIGRTIVEQYYSWDGKANDLESFLGFLLGGAPRRIARAQGDS